MEAGRSTTLPAPRVVRAPWKQIPRHLSFSRRVEVIGKLCWGVSLSLGIARSVDEYLRLGGSFRFVTKSTTRNYSSIPLAIRNPRARSAYGYRLTNCQK